MVIVTEMVEIFVHIMTEEQITDKIITKHESSVKISKLRQETCEIVIEKLWKVEIILLDGYVNDCNFYDGYKKSSKKRSLPTVKGVWCYDYYTK